MGPTGVAALKEIFKAAEEAGLSTEDINIYLKGKGYLKTKDKPSSLRTDKKSDEIILAEVDVYKKGYSLLSTLIFKVYPVFFFLSLFMFPIFKMVTMSTCLLSDLMPFGDVVAAPFINCDMCRGLLGAPRLSNLSKDDFIRNYAYTGRPILVEGAALNWSAVQTFSYDYFKSLYLSVPSSLDEDFSTPQFFSYSSNIKDLRDLFSLPNEVASMETEKWYIGW